MKESLAQNWLRKRREAGMKASATFENEDSIRATRSLANETNLKVGHYKNEGAEAD